MIRMSLSDSMIQPLPGPRCRRIFGLVTAQVLWLHLTLSQLPQGIFGACTEKNLRSVPAGLFVESHKGGKHTISVLMADPAVLTAYALDDDGSLREEYSSQLHVKCRSWLVSDLDGDGVAELLGLTQASDTLVIARHNGEVVSEISLPLNVRPQKIVVADIDNDRRREILLFGRSMAGMLVLKGGRGLSYHVGPHLFQDVSAIDVAVTDLNGDGIADVFLANWLSNRVAVFFGISRGVFSEQLNIELEGEPSGLALTPVTNRQTAQLAVVLSNQKRIVVYSGNGAGEFRKVAVIVCPIQPATAAFLDLNGDTWPDLIAASERGIMTIVARSSVEFEHPVAYGVGNVIGLWKVADAAGDKQTELVCADRREKRLIVAARSEQRGKTSHYRAYLTGDRPTGVILSDVDNDGDPDIVVTNSGSSSLSVFLNKGGGEFAAQWSVATADNPSALQATVPDGSTFVVAHHAKDRLSVIRLRDATHPVSFTIPTATDPSILSVLQRDPEQALRILVRSRGGPQQSTTFSVFEQLTGKTFLEKTFQTSLPVAIHSLAVGDVTGNGRTDLIFASYDREGRTTSVSCAPAGQDFSYQKVTPLLTVPDTTNFVHSIASADVDNDGLEDILLAAGPPRNSLGIAFARARGVFSDEIYWLEGVSPANDASLIVQDLDGDGYRDIAVLDQLAKSVNVLYGMANRKFSFPRRIATADGVRQIAVGALRAAKTPDLVMTHESRGVVTVMYSPFRR